LTSLELNDARLNKQMRLFGQILEQGARSGKPVGNAQTLVCNLLDRDGPTMIRLIGRSAKSFPNNEICLRSRLSRGPRRRRVRSGLWSPDEAQASIPTKHGGMLLEERQHIATSQLT
jgi:hypothetical protein